MPRTIPRMIPRIIPSRIFRDAKSSPMKGDRKHRVLPEVVLMTGDAKKVVYIKYMLMVWKI